MTASDAAVRDQSLTTGTPYQRVGVIGGGQLAWMMTEAALKLGLELYVQTPSVTDPAIANATPLMYQPATTPTLAAIDDAQATQQLAQRCQVITFENEFVDLDALSQLTQQGVTFRPPLTALQPLLDKYEQRTLLQRLQIPCPRFMALSPSEPALPADWGFPIVVKARRHGYDGQGTFIVADAAALEQLWHTTALPPDQQASPLMAEEFIPFDRELAIMAARSVTGEVALYPVVETYQAQQVCQWARTPVALPDQTRHDIEAIATDLLTELDIVGIIGIEFFLTASGQVLVNEIAPRTHNSGHLSQDACHTSQFEQQLRAVCGLPLGDPGLTHPGAIMINLLGYEVAESDYAHQRQALSRLPQTVVHWYGKTQARPGRKLGHVNVLLNTANRAPAIAAAQRIAELWYPSKSNSDR